LIARLRLLQNMRQVSPAAVACAFRSAAHTFVVLLL